MPINLTVVPALTTRPATVDATATGLTPGTRYNVRIDSSVTATARARNDGTLSVGIAIGTASSIGTHPVDIRDSSNKNTLKAASVAVTSTPPPPPVVTVPSVPQSLSGVVGDTVVNLAWTAPASSGGVPVSKYRVFKAGLLVGEVTGLSTTVSGLVNGTLYSFQVAAVNSVGEGPKTSAVALTPIGPVVPPTGPTVPAGLAEGTITLQQAIDQTPTGSGFGVPPRSFREFVTISKAISLEGVGPAGVAEITGKDAAGNVVRPNWMKVNASGVLIRKLGMHYAAGTNATGSLETAIGVRDVVFEDCDVSHSYVNVNFQAGIGVIFRRGAIHDAISLGLRVSAPNPSTYGKGCQLLGAKLFNNGRGTGNLPADASNLKATYQDDFVMRDNEVYDGVMGLWLDASCRRPIYENNKVHHNDTCGIQDETSTGAKITGNAAWSNGFGQYGSWGWGAGILIHSSKDAEVAANVCAWNRTGISVIEEDRGDSPGVTGNNVHDNFVAMVQPSSGNDRWGLFWAYSLPSGSTFTPIIYAAGSNNRGTNNRFSYPAAENQYARFIWNGYHNLASFVDVPGGQTSTYVASSVKDAVLAAAGIPIAPPSTSAMQSLAQARRQPTVIAGAGRPGRAGPETYEDDPVYEQ